MDASPQDVTSCCNDPLALLTLHMFVVCPYLKELRRQQLLQCKGQDAGFVMLGGKVFLPRYAIHCVEVTGVLSGVMLPECSVSYIHCLCFLYVCRCNGFDCDHSYFFLFSCLS